jgi:hypothetical protein
MLGKGAASAATALFLVGRLLLYRLTGRLSDEARLSHELPGLGPRRTLELERIAEKALQPDPRRRFRSAIEFRDALARDLGDSSRTTRLLEPGELTVGRGGEPERIDAALRHPRMDSQRPAPGRRLREGAAKVREGAGRATI